MFLLAAHSEKMRGIVRPKCMVDFGLSQGCDTKAHRSACVAIPALSAALIKIHVAEDSTPSDKNVCTQS